MNKSIDSNSGPGFGETTAPVTVPSRLPLGLLLANLTVVILPFVGVVVAIALLWGWAFSWVDLGLLIGMYLVTGLGITVGFHRLFTHRSFETFAWVKFIWAALGSMAAQGTLFEWVALHRQHHQHSDQPGDPHSPRLHGRGILGMFAGLWHAHVGWLFGPGSIGLERYVTDLQKSGSLRVVSALFPLWVAIGLLVPALLGGLLTLSWMGALFGLLWGGLVRMFLVHHVTWGVNSLCHLWGSRTHDNHDHSTNNALLGLLALGEGWHNNHHHAPTSAQHGVRWWQVDMSFWVIRTLALVGLAWKVKLAPRSVPVPTGV